MEINQQPPIIHTAYNPVVVKLADSSATTTSISLTAGTSTPISMQRYLLNGNVLFEISSILKNLFENTITTSTLSDQIQIDHNLFVDYTLTAGGQNLIAEKTSLMTGESSELLKTFSPTWTVDKTGVTAGLKFDPTTYNADGTSATATEDKLILSIYDESPYIKNSIHSNTFDSNPILKTYDTTESASIRVSTPATTGPSMSYIDGTHVTNDVSFASYTGTNFSMSGNTLTAINACKISITGNLAISVTGTAISISPGGSVTIFGNTIEDASWNAIYDEEDTIVAISVPVNLTISLQAGDTLSSSLILYYQTGEANSAKIPISIGDGGTAFSFEVKSSIPATIASNINFDTFSNSYFSTANNTITILKAGTVRISGSYVIIITYTNLSGSISPTAGQLNIGSTEIAISYSNWNISGNVATITVPFDFTITATASQSLATSFSLTAKTTNEGGTVSAATADFNFVLTQTPTAYSDGVNFTFKILNASSSTLYSVILNKTAIASNYYYIFSLDFEDIFTTITTQQLTFNLYEINSSESEVLIATATPYYIYNPTFVNPTTRTYNGQPFYRINQTFTAINAVAQLAESPDLTPCRGTFLTQLDRLLLYPGYPRQVSCLSFKDGTYVNLSGMPLNPDDETPLTTTLFNIQLTDTNDYVALSNQYPGHYLQAGTGEIITTNDRGEIITIAQPATGYTEHRLAIETPCLPPNPYYVRWINRQGGYDYWMFSFRQTIKEKIKITDTYNPVVYNPLTAEAFSRTIGVEGTATITVGASGLTDNEYQALSKIIYAPRIQYFDTNKSIWITLSISDSDVEKDTYTPTQEIEITFLLPTPQVQF